MGAVGVSMNRPGRKYTIGVRVGSHVLRCSLTGKVRLFPLGGSGWMWSCGWRFTE